MKRWNPIIAALMVALMLCSAFAAAAEMDVELETPSDPGEIELELDPEADGAALLDDAPELDGDLALDGLELADLALEADGEGENPPEGIDAENNAIVQSNFNDSGLWIDGSTLVLCLSTIGGHIVIPDGITTIGAWAFGSCSGLTGVTIPNSVTSIEEGAFSSCSKLTNITIPDSVTSIGESAFSFCKSLTSITIPNSVTSIERETFMGCSSLSSVTIPNSVTSIGYDAFRWCESLTSITIPNSVTSIERETFEGCYSLASVTIPSSVTSIGEEAFMYCSSLTNITIPNGVTEINPSTFNGCTSLTSVNMPSSVTEIWQNAFNGCSSLTSITIPSGVTIVSVDAFNGCSSLTSVTILAPQISISYDAFYNCNDNLRFEIVCNSNAVNQLSGYTKSLIHNKVIDSAIEPTYTSAGRTEGSHCTVCGMVFQACEILPAIGLTKTSLSLNLGESEQLSVNSLGNRTVTWSSSNDKIATVVNGKVTAKEVGQCTITATLNDGSLTCNVTVKDRAEFSKSKLSLNMGKTQTLKIDNLAGREVTWSTSNIKIATVKNGEVVAKKVGKCTITAQIKNGKTLTCMVTVTDPAALSAQKLTITSIDSAKIKLSGDLKRKVTWSTSNAKVVKITKRNANSVTIKAVKAGSATITAKIKGGKTLKCKVRVVNPLTISEYLDEDLDDLDSWEVRVNFTNNTNKKIIYVKFNILQYNNRGDKLKSPYSYYYFNDDIPPHESDYDIYQINDDTRKVKFKIIEVTFSDKKKWKP